VGDNLSRQLSRTQKKHFKVLGRSLRGKKVDPKTLSEALRSIPGLAKDEIKSRLSTADLADRQQALSLVHRLDRDPAVELWTLALKDSSEDIRMTAAGMLANYATYNDTQTINSLCGCLYDVDDNVRKSAASALDSIGIQNIQEINHRIACLLVLDSRNSDIVAIGTAAIPELQRSINDVSKPNDNNLDQRLRAVEALRKIVIANGLTRDNGTHLDTLARALNDRSSHVRLEALNTIGAIVDVGLWSLRQQCLTPIMGLTPGSSQIDDMEAIIGRFRDNQKSIRSAATETIAKIGKPAIDRLIQTLDDKTPTVQRLGAVALVGIVNRTKQIDPDDPARCEIMTAFIRKLGDDKSASFICKCLETETVSIPFLIEALGNNDRKIRERAAKVLDDVGVVAVPELIRAVKTGTLTPIMDVQVTKVLSKKGQDILPGLVAELKTDDPDEKTRLAVLLTKLGKKTIPTLFSAVDTGDEQLEENSITVLVAMKKDTITYLDELMDEIPEYKPFSPESKGHDETKARVVKVFSAIGKDAIPHLGKILANEKHYAVHGRIIQIFKDLKDPEGIPHLMGVPDNNPFWGDNALWAMEHIAKQSPGSDEALDVVVPLAKLLSRRIEIIITEPGKRKERIKKHLEMSESFGMDPEEIKATRIRMETQAKSDEHFDRDIFPSSITSAILAIVENDPRTQQLDIGSHIEKALEYEWDTRQRSGLNDCISLLRTMGKLSALEQIWDIVYETRNDSPRYLSGYSAIVHICKRHPNDQKSITSLGRARQNPPYGFELQQDLTLHYLG